METDGSITIHKRNCSEAIKIASQQGDSIVSVDFQKDEKVLYPVSIQIVREQGYLYQLLAFESYNEDTKAWFEYMRNSPLFHQ